VTVAGDDQRTRPEKSEVDRLLADNSLAYSLLGWTPTVTLEDGLARTIEWMGTHLERYRPSVYAI
jgi:dTDP-glucose 4,6-dehydratase